jgi:APA family basic amino acid/polyamine antiporter
VKPTLHRSLSAVEYFTFGFGSMVGVGWLVIMDDWLGRGGPAGAALGFLVGGLLLLPIAATYGRLVRDLPDAGAEIAYTDGVFPRFLSFATGWTMVLAYAIVCPWEAVAIGNLLARVLPGLNTIPMYSVAGHPIYLPRVIAGLFLTAIIATVNYRGIRLSGLFQDVTTFGLLAIFAVFVALGFWRGSSANLAPAFARPGAAGALVSTLLVLQIVPYFMTGFESVAKGSEEAKTGFDPADFGRAMKAAVLAGATFYVLIVLVVAYVYPWREVVSGSVGTEIAFQRAFGSRGIAELILIAAFLSLFKVYNGNFVAATRLLFAIGRRGLVHRSLSALQPRFGTPAGAILLLAVITAVASLLGDSVLVPISEVGSMAVGVGWCSACVAYLLRGRRAAPHAALAVIGGIVGAGIVLMKALPAIPGSFTMVEWLAFFTWCALGLVFWLARTSFQNGAVLPD